MLPKIITLSNKSCTRKTTVLPDGKKMVFTRGFRYTTSAPKELNHFSKTGGFRLLDLSEKDTRKFLESLPVVPTLDVRVSDDEAKKYLWFDKDEEYVIAELLKRGFISKKVGNEKDTIMAIRKEMRMKGLKDEEILDEVTKRELNIVKTIEKTTEYPEDILVASLKELGYTVYKKNVKAK